MGLKQYHLDGAGSAGTRASTRNDAQSTESNQVAMFVAVDLVRDLERACGRVKSLMPYMRTPGARWRSAIGKRAEVVYVPRRLTVTGQ